MKDNKTLAGIVGLMVVGSLGLGAYLYTSYSSFSEKQQQWDNLVNTSKQLKSKKIYPDQENYETLQSQIEEYDSKVNILRTALSSDKVQQPITPMSESAFQAKLKDRINAVRQAAAAAEVRLPDGFALGFDEYTSAPPSSEQAASELNVQLDVIERLVGVLIESRVKSIESLSRTKLKVESGPAPAPAPATNNRNKNQALAKAEPEPIIEKFPITLTIIADQAPFQNVVNILADPGKMSHFLVLRNLSLQNEASEAPLTDEIKNKLSQAAAPLDRAAVDPAAAPANAAAPTTVAPLPVDAVTIMGEEKLTVNLVVDYLRVKAEKTEETAEAAAPKANP